MWTCKVLSLNPSATSHQVKNALHYWFWNGNNASHDYDQLSDVNRISNRHMPNDVCAKTGSGLGQKGTQIETAGLAKLLGTDSQSHFLE